MGYSKAAFGFSVLAISMSVFAAASARAATTISVDFADSGTKPTNFPDTPAGSFSNNSGVGVAPAAGTFWNSPVVGVGNGDVHASITASSLLQSDGATVTGVSMTLGNYAAQNQQGSYSSVGGYTPTFAPNLFGKDVYTPDTGTFTISGLSAGDTVDLYLYSMGGYPNANNTTFVVNGITTTLTGLPSVYGSAFAPVTEGTTGGGNYVLYSHVPAVGGTITGTFAGSNVRFNALQVVELPEPASLGMLGAGAMALLARRRK